MKICLVSHEYPRPGGASWGGVGAYTYNMAHALAAIGHTVFVIASDDAPSRWIEEGITVIRLPLNAPKVITQRTAEQVFDYSERVKACMDSLHREDGVDIVEFPDFAAEGYSFIISGQSEPPHVLRLHTCLELVFRNDERQWKPEARKIAQMEKDAISSARHITSPSRFLIRQTDEVAKISAHSAQIAPNPVDTNFFKPGKDSEDATIFCPGRLQRLKGTHVLVEAMGRILKKFPLARFVFAGRDTRSGPDGGSYRAHLESLIGKTMRGSVDFLGEVSREEMARLYASATVVVTPSLYDNFPNTVLEAMASAKPVVASAVGGIPEMLREGEGILVPPGDPEELADAIIALLGDKSLREKIAARGHDAAMNRYSFKTAAKQMTAAYEIVLRGVLSCASQ